MTSEAPESRYQIRRWFVELGICDGGGIGLWEETVKSIEVTNKDEAQALGDDWLSSGEINKTSWGELRPNYNYGVFRIRSIWEDAPSIHQQALAEAEARGYARAVEDAARKVGFLRDQDDDAVWMTAVDEATEVIRALSPTPADPVAKMTMEALDESWPSDWQAVWKAMKEDAPMMLADDPTAFYEVIRALAQKDNE